MRSFVTLFIITLLNFQSLILVVLCTSHSTEIPSTTTLVYDCDKYSYLPMENARIRIQSTNENNPILYAYGITDECYKCLHLPFPNMPLIPNEQPLCFIIDTHWPFSIGFSTQKPFSGCNNQSTCAWQPDNYTIPPKSYHYDEHAHYMLTVADANSFTLTTTKSAPNKYIPLYIALAVIFVIIISYNIYRLYLKDSCCNDDKEDSVLEFEQRDNSKNSDYDDDNNGKVKTSKKKRFISLDAFRGMSLIIMIFVNYGGGGYWWLSHSKWNGLTVADLVFPWFMFIMGAAMGIVFPKYLLKIYKANDNSRNNLLLNDTATTSVTRFTVVKRVVIRGIKLFLIGLLIINRTYDLQTMRVPGVLQYFAVAYTINGLILIFTEPRCDTDEFKENSKPSKWNLFIPEVMLYWKQWLIAMCILLINMLIVYELPVTMYGEKCPKGYTGPGGIGDYGQHMECTGGAHRLVDYKLWDAEHCYGSPEPHKMYHTGWYDPEGTMGALTATMLTFFGILFGRILFVYKSHKERISRWLVMSVIFGLIAGILCGFKKNGGWIPVNKNLWSLSFILTQASTGTFVIAIFYILIDVYNIWDGKPFHWLGSNSIIIYTGSEVFGDYFPFGFEYGNENHYKSLLSNCIGITVWIYIAGYLFYKGVRYAL